MKRRLSDRVSNGRRAFMRARRRSVPVRILVPNIVTLLGLCVGLTSIRMAIEGRFDYALLAIVGAALIDGLDGRMARLLKASSRFGAELDSLSDFVCFGVAPAIVLYLWAFSAASSVGWIVVMVFAVATALRLARFNVALDDAAKPVWENAFFVGIPAPAGALLLMLPLYVEGLGLPKSWMPAPLIGFYAISVAGLMASRVRTFSGKMTGQRIGPELIAPVIALGVFLVATLVTYPYLSGTVACLTYFALIPVSVRRHTELSQQLATVDAQAITHDGWAAGAEARQEPTRR